MDKQKQIEEEFLTWLTSSVEEFKGNSVEECRKALNMLLQKEENHALVENLFNTFMEHKKKASPTGQSEYLKTLRAQGGAKVKTVVGPDGSILNRGSWEIVGDETDREGKRKQTAMNDDTFDIITLTTGPKGDSVYRAHDYIWGSFLPENPQMHYVSHRRHYNPTAYNGLNFLQKVREWFNRPSPAKNNWEEASRDYGEIFKNATPYKQK